MADFDSNAVNANAAMLALINAGKGGGDAAPQGPFDKMINQGAQNVTAAHGGGGLRLVAALNGSGQGYGPSKLLKQMGLTLDDIRESLKKIADAGAVVPCSQADLFGQGGPSGGSFVGMASDRSAGGDIDHSV